MPKIGHRPRFCTGAGVEYVQSEGLSMQTPEFAAALDRLIEISRVRCTAIMCSEAVPWICHRSLIADALSVRGIAVEHIIRSPILTMPMAIRLLIRCREEREGRPERPPQAEGLPHK